jgi:hypothetical protein
VLWSPDAPRAAKGQGWTVGAPQMWPQRQAGASPSGAGAAPATLLPASIFLAVMRWPRPGYQPAARTLPVASMYMQFCLSRVQLRC